jgi:RNA polymerase sigma factor (sigma-70 family)
MTNRAIFLASGIFCHIKETGVESWSGVELVNSLNFFSSLPISRFFWLGLAIIRCKGAILMALTRRDDEAIGDSTLPSPSGLLPQRESRDIHSSNFSDFANTSTEPSLHFEAIDSVESNSLDFPADLTDHAFETYLSKIRHKPRLDIDQERALFDALLKKNADAGKARQAIVEAHLWLVPIIVRRFVRGGSNFEDLVAEGNLGLFESIDRFDSSRGLRFSSYAKWWVLHFVTSAMSSSGFSVRLPRHIAQAMLKRRRSAHSNAVEPNDAPDLDETLDQSLIDWTAPAVAETEVMSLAIKEELQPDHIVALKQQLRKLSDSVATLPDRERQVLTMRYGLNDSEILTLQEVGQKLGLTAERVRTIQIAATERLSLRLAAFRSVVLDAKSQIKLKNSAGSLKSDGRGIGLRNSDDEFFYGDNNENHT